MLCPKCGGKVRTKVSLFLDIPSELEHQLSKEKMRSRDVRIEGAGWDTTLEYCTNPRCGWLFSLRRTPEPKP